MAHRSPSTLDEETALAVALSISKEETKKSPPSSSATPSRETVGKPDGKVPTLLCELVASKCNESFVKQ